MTSGPSSTTTPEPPLTPRQQEAATTTGRDVIVTASAGSGKTSVLAQRCCYLVCDAPAEVRCELDQLLVVTFGEAAAAEMRARIRRALQQHPQPSTRVSRQLLLVDQAHISTLHAFCRRLLRQHFMHLNLDPNASVLVDGEAQILLAKSIEAVFDQWHRRPDARRDAFHALLRDYGNGREFHIADLLTRMHHFVRSLHDPDAWLSGAARKLGATAGDIAAEECVALQRALQRQLDLAEVTLDYVRRRAPQWPQPIAAMNHHIDHLRRCRQQLDAGPAAYDACREAIAGYRFKSLRAAKTRASGPQDQVRRVIEQVRKNHKADLEARFAIWTLAERHDSQQRIAPYVETVVELLAAVQQRYAAAKARRHTMDFNDMEQLAYRLLTDPDNGVAAVVRRRFAQVLVDEFQDINPLQDAILRQVTRPADDPAGGNFFCVGDVKQSIYSFRMADHHIFRERLEGARRDGPVHPVILTENFRSSPRIIAAVNAVCGRLMTAATAGVAYDADAALTLGAAWNDPSPAVEVHFIEKQAATPEGDQDDEDPLEIRHQVDIERQARLIGQRIQCLVHDDGLRYGDIAILLRAATIRAERMARVLLDLDIPIRADANSGFFAAVEVADVMALLRVLDNRQQDIPLASVMRSGVTGIPFSEADLLTIRQSQEHLPFHHCVLQYAKVAGQAPLGRRVERLLDRLDHWRRRSRQLPLGALLHELLLDTGYTAYVAGRPGGRQRLANLELLQQRAAEFSRGGGPGGLHEYSEYVQALQRHGRDQGQGSPSTAPDDVVRLTTIHTSKGLQFPVVFLANLEKHFNFSDSSSRLVLHRDGIIGMPVAVPEQRVRYPSLSSDQAKQRLQAQTRSEELRLLYVALTRARHRLVLVGSTAIDELLEQRTLWDGHPGAIPEAFVQRARSSLDWLTQALCCLPDDEACWSVDPAGPGDPLFDIVLHRDLPVGPDARQSDAALAARRAACAALHPLPDGEPLADPAATVDPLFAGLESQYGHAAMCTVPSVLAVSQFAADQERPAFQQRRGPRGQQRTPPARPQFMDLAEAPSAAESGSATHVFLQHLDYSQPDTLDTQLQQQVARGTISGEHAKAIKLERIAWFLQTALGQRAVAVATALQREVTFTARAHPRDYNPQAESSDPADLIVVRGMVDLLIPTDGGFEIVDFKTDRLRPADLRDRLSVYRDQITRYARALAGIWRCRIAPAAVVFLEQQHIENVDVGQ